MIRRERSGKYLAATGSDTDALQTDVMRFMSILGLCLMAVFALVQSIPRQDTEGIQTGPELEKLQYDIELQQQRAQLLEAHLERLTAQTRSAQQRTAGAQQALSSTRRQLTLLTDQAGQARSERDRLSAELTTLTQQVAQARRELARIEQQIAIDGQTLSPASMLARLNELGGRHGIGRVDLDEGRALAGQQAGLARQAAADKMVGRAGDQGQGG